MSRQEEMYSLIEQWKESGLIKTKFCKERKIPVHRFNYWIKKHKTESIVKPSAVDVNFFSLSPSEINAPKKNSSSKTIQKSIFCIELANGTKISFY
jgi:hypothetical protein